MASSSGGKIIQLLVLLAILGGGLGWNYKRNAEAEATEVRPYRGYSDAELEQLKAAQQSETDRRNAVYRAGSPKVTVQDRALLGDRVDEFERVRKISARKRELASRVADSRASIKLIEAEQVLRERDRPIYKMILRRTFTYRPF